ncbi:MAG: KaiC domain-containing protein, partial [Candidatus Bathyarchaeia archaeon]
MLYFYFAVIHSNLRWIALNVERLSTGIEALDKMLLGGIPRGFSVAVTGEPGTGKTILCLHFIARGIAEGDRCIYVTTEESRDSIIAQASQFGFDFSKAIKEGRLIIIDALMGTEDQWTIKSLSVEELVNKVIEAKKALGYGRARLVIDSLSAFWLDKPAMSRRHSYFVKKVLAKWDFTI